MKKLRVGIVGVGKIARDQHIPALRANPAFEFIACASRHAQVDGVANFPNLEAMLDGAPDLDAVTICTPPQVHYEAARTALRRGKHVFLEKPPCATTAELEQLARQADDVARTLFQSWHSRHAAGVEAARQWLEPRTIRDIRITWKEDVRYWHPGQTWIWEAGGFGVLDPGINALSILTTILARPIFAREATLFFPQNCEAPIAADISLTSSLGTPISAAFDFRHTGIQTWDIDVRTDGGALKLAEGGAVLSVDGERIGLKESDGEYPSLYRHFAELVRQSRSEVDATPFRLVADIFLIGKRIGVERFD